jgi:hypothetical protein
MADKRLILAVAGSGKTTYLINQLNLEERFLIVTYTNTSLNLIKRKIIKEYGYLPNNIKTQTYFEFLYGFCIKPFVLFKYQAKGISWETSPEHTTYLPNTELSKYLSKNRYFYYNRLGKFIEFENITDDIKSRFEKFYDHFFFDEFQDLGGHDFNFITQISKARINFLFVGDFFQNTYLTSYDGVVNNSLYKNYERYCARIKENEIKIDTETLSNSHRCSPIICNFIKNNLGINIASHREDETLIIPITNKNEIQEIIENHEIIKLVYDRSNERHFYSKNWGDCKGEDDYMDTCVILNKNTSKLFKKGKLLELAPRTKNKLYVALSRTRGNCYLVDDELID